MQMGMGGWGRGEGGAKINGTNYECISRLGERPINAIIQIKWTPEVSVRVILANSVANGEVSGDEGRTNSDMGERGDDIELRQIIVKYMYA